MADPEYARLNTGVSITRGNSGNGALPTRGSEQAENERDVEQITDVRTRRLPFGNDHLHTPAMWAVWQTESRDDNESRVTSLTGPAALPIRPTSAQPNGRAEPPRLLRSIATTLRLRRDTVRESIGMKIGVVTHTGPGTVLLGGLRHSCFFTGGKVVP